MEEGKGKLDKKSRGEKKRRIRREKNGEGWDNNEKRKAGLEEKRRVTKRKIRKGKRSEEKRKKGG